MVTWRLWTESDRARVTTAESPGDRAIVNHLSRLRLTLYDRPTGGKLPRNHESRSYRLSCGAHLLAATTLCYRRMKNCLEVSTALFADGTTELSSIIIRELLRFVLTDAYRCSGLCALLFGGFSSPQERRILAQIEAFLLAAGIPPAPSPRKILTVEEGRDLYLYLSELSPAGCDAARLLDREERVRAETTCYLVQCGAWSASQMEAFLLACDFPDVILGGGGGSEDRHLHGFAQRHTQTALLAGRLEDYLQNRWLEQEGVVRPEILSTRLTRTEILRSGWWRFRAEPGAERALPLDAWARSAYRELDERGLAAWPVTASRDQIDANWEAIVAGVPRDEVLAGENVPLAIVLPADFDQLREAVRAECLKKAEEQGITVLVAPDTLPQLAAEAQRKLNLSRMIRK